MKTTSCNTTLLLCLLPILLVACQSESGSAMKDPYTVDMKATKDSTEIEILSDDQGCETNGHGKKGCVQCKKNKECTIEFRLNLAQGQVGKTCQATPPPDWVITKVELSPDGSSLTNKGDFPKEPSGWMKNAFEGIDGSNGSLPVPANPTQSITVIDLNNHRYGGLKTAYYQVTATSCGVAPRTIQIDPAIQNKGR